MEILNFKGYRLFRNVTKRRGRSEGPLEWTRTLKFVIKMGFRYRCRGN